MNLYTAPIDYSLTKSIEFIYVGESRAIRVRHPKASGVISLHGAHVLSYQPTGEEDLLWLSGNSQFDGKAAIRGGIPVCFPWFAKAASPSHGFARTSEWQLHAYQITQENALITLQLKDDQGTDATWPHPFKARLLFEVGEELNVTLEVMNIGGHPWTFTGALHTYLNIGDIDTLSVTGLGKTFIDKLDENAPQAEPETLSVTSAIDRIYTEPKEEIVVHDPTLGRDIIIKNSGHNSAVVWNPWQEGAQSMADMQDDGYQHMLCVESVWYAPTIEEGKTVQPAKTYQLSTNISSRPR